MAILSNGRFSGFLCSIKDTGKKLKNGARVMVDDFLSGFNGYGWKLWKKDERWRLEIDDLLVRKSFTSFEHIISQITSIKGAYSISQGHAKIKSVSIVDNVDVYKETQTNIYNEDFSDSKWVNDVSAGDTPTLSITKNTIKLETAVDYAQTFMVDNSVAVNSMTIEVKGVTNTFFYTYINDSDVVDTVMIQEDGTYTLPASKSLNTEATKGFLFSPNVAVTITLLPISSEITESVVQAQCYRLEIDDESNSIVEYDFVQCLNNGRYYLVQVGSVFQYYINIPVSEFDSDPDTGEILNAPQAGDEIVQFGNASHQEKYRNRHSAIYMHLDEEEPAIDLMTDLYTKDWSNAIKVRVGGNLPNTDGDRGFYSVNGKLISVDEEGEVVYQINPDGSGFFARGKFSWTKDGSPKFSGTILLQIDENNVWEVTEAGENIIGNKSGRRIVISPVSQDIKVFDDNDKNVLSIEGTSRKNIEDFFGGTIPTINIKNIPFTISNTLQGEIVISDMFSTDTIMNISAEMYYYYSVYAEGSGSYFMIQMQLLIDTYSDINMTKYEKSTVVASYSNMVTGTGNFVIRGNVNIDKGYHVFRVFLNKHLNVTSLSITAVTVGININSYIASLFSNGIALGTSTNNLFYVLNKEHGLLNETDIFFDVENNAAGFKINEFRSLTKASGNWGITPSLIAYGVVWGGTLPTYKYLRSFDGSTSSYFNITRLGEGIYRITFPTSWKQLNIGASNAYVMLTGMGFSLVEGGQNAPIKATFKQWVTNGFDVWLSDDSTVNDGDFTFEVKWLGN